jgi:hypothetical protein
MTFEQLTNLISNSTEIWMAGMMTIQTLIIILGAWLAYNEFVLKQNEPKRIASSRLFEIDYLIDDELETIFKENSLNINDPIFQEQFSSFPNKYLWSIIRVYQIRNKIIDEPSTIFINEIEKELEIVGNEDLKFLFYDKLNLRTYIEGDFINAFSELVNLSFIINSLQESEIEKRVQEIFKEIPSHSSHRISQNVINFWDTKKEIQRILKPMMRTK